MTTTQALPNPILTQIQRPMNPTVRSEQRTPVSLGETITTAVGPLDGAVAYANILAKTGSWPSVGVVQAGEGWKLQSLYTGDAGSRTPLRLDYQQGDPIGGPITDRLQRHSYQLAAVVGPVTAATWSGKQRIAQPAKL